MNRNRPFFTLLVSTILLGSPALTLARGGGGGGGHGGGGGGHFGGGGGHYGGGHYGGGWGRGYGYGRAYGWGRGYGWGGYPYYGYGLGLGVGLGVGYGLSAGYGYGGYGYGGYGYGGYGYGYPAYGSYGYDPYYGTNPGTYYPPATATYAPSTAPYAGSSANPNATMSAPASTAPPQAAIGMAASTREFAEKGEAAFKAGDYQGAVYAWRHAAVDDPQNGVMALMLGQALFATGKFDEAAGAVQAGIHQLPKDQWGVVVSHYTELYGKKQDFTSQLRALERAMKAKSDDPALRFLTGFQYAYLGFTEQAIEQLDHAIKLAPRDEMAKQLRDTLRAKTARPAAVPPLPGIPTGPALLPTPQESDEE